MSKRSSILFLKDILTSISLVEKYIKGQTSSTFSHNQKTIDAVVRNIEIIGEAAKNLPKTITQKYPGIPWQRVISMRNKISHEYFGIDTEILWETIKKDLPLLKEELSRK